MTEKQEPKHTAGIEIDCSNSEPVSELHKIEATLYDVPVRVTLEGQIMKFDVGGLYFESELPPIWDDERRVEVFKNHLAMLRAR